MSIAMLSILILVCCIILFITEKISLLATSLLGCCAMVVFGVCKFEQAFSPFASSTVMLAIGMIVMGNAMFEVGAAQLLGRKIIQLAGDREKRLLLITMIAAATLSAFLSNTATIVLFMSMINAIAAVNSNIKAKNLIMPVGMATVSGGVCTLIGSPPQLVAHGILLENLGQGFSFFEFAFVGIPLTLALILYFYFFGYSLGRKTWGHRGDTATRKASLDESMTQDLNLNMKKVYLVLGIFGATILALVFEVLPSIGVTCLLGGLACILTGCIPQKTALAKMDWNAIGILGGTMGIAKGLDVSGGGELIAATLVGVLGAEVNPFLLFCGLLLIAAILTQFMSNTAVTAVMVPISIYLCINLGLEPRAFAMGIVMAANLSFMTPIATIPLTLTLASGYRFSDYTKIGSGATLIGLLVVIVCCWLFFPLVSPTALTLGI